MASLLKMIHSRRHGLVALMGMVILFSLLIYQTVYSALTAHDFRRIVKTILLPSPTEDSVQDVDLLNALKDYRDVNLNITFVEGYYEGQTWAAESVDRLINCLETSTCGAGERTIVILGCYHFWNGFAGTGASGEDVWGASSVSAFQSLNYTLIYLPKAPMILKAHHHLSSLISLIIWDSSELGACVPKKKADQDRPKEFMKECVKREGYEEGIPIWRTFTLHFWNGPEHPLGPKWTLSPEPYKHKTPNTYLGYSIEASCDSYPFPNPPDRQHQAVLLGKSPEYFMPLHFAYQNLLPQVASQIDPYNSEAFTLVSSTTLPHADGNWWTEEEAEEVKNQVEGVELLGIHKKSEWFELLSRSKAMIGIGNPFISPSPYDGLCMGIPFINSVSSIDANDPTNRTKWNTQHDTLRDYDPPYVYNVVKNDLEGLVSAIQSAITNPIERYILPHMTFQAVVERHKMIVETDWAEMAVGLMEEANKDREGPRLIW